MNLFIYHSRVIIANSKLKNELKSIDDFIKFENGYIRVDITQLSISYIRLHVETSLKAYGQLLVNFLVPAMIYEVEETIFKFVFKGNTNLIATNTFNIDDYRRKLIMEIEKQNKFWEAKLIKHEVIIYIGDPLADVPIYRLINFLDLAVKKTNAIITPVPTVIRFIGSDDGRYSITVNSSNYQEENNGYA